MGISKRAMSFRGHNYRQIGSQNTSKIPFLEEIQGYNVSNILKEQDSVVEKFFERKNYIAVQAGFR